MTPPAGDTPGIEDGTAAHLLGLAGHAVDDARAVIVGATAGHWEGAAAGDYDRMRRELLTHAAQLQGHLDSAVAMARLFHHARHAALRGER